jgi:hypothetical protein
MHESPVNSSDSDATFDPHTREVTLEQTPGEQPVTIAGGPLGPNAGPDGADEPEGSEETAR